VKAGILDKMMVNIITNTSRALRWRRTVQNALHGIRKNLRPCCAKCMPESARPRRHASYISTAKDTNHTKELKIFRSCISCCSWLPAPAVMLHASAHEKVKDLSFVRVFRAVRGHPHLAILVRNGTLHKRLLWSLRGCWALGRL